MSYSHTKRSLAAECMSNDMAFPALDTAFTPNGTVQCGLTKREYFAAMAMQGLIARGASYSLQDAGIALRYADTLIEALSDETITGESDGR